MNRRIFLQFAAMATVGMTGRQSAADDTKRIHATVIHLNELLEPIRSKYDLPGLAAAAMRDNRVVAEGVAGVRRLGSAERIAIDDCFAIGSCTKLMTALMIARLIDAGKLSFDTRLSKALPKLKMADAYRDATVAQLLSFTAGIQPYTAITPAATPILFQKEGSPADRRRQFVEHVLNEEPVAKPGTKSHYSNAGYVVLGQIAADCNGCDFESALRDTVFTPLQLSRAGFGRPCTKDRPNQPWLHVRRGDAFVPEPDRDRPVEVVLAAAGDVHCSIHDLAKLANYQLLAAQGKDPQLQPPTAKRMQELQNPTSKDCFAAFGGTPWLSAGVNAIKSKNLAIAFGINAGAEPEVGQAVLKAVRERLDVQ